MGRSKLVAKYCPKNMPLEPERPGPGSHVSVNICTNFVLVKQVNLGCTWQSEWEKGGHIGTTHGRCP